MRVSPLARRLSPPWHHVQISRVQTTLPPYVLPPLDFPFRHLAALAGRAPIGGAREVALACFLAARLASGRLDGSSPAGAGPSGTASSGSGSPAIVDRGNGARGWVSSLALPAPVRGPLGRCLDAVGVGSRPTLAAELSALAAASAPFLDTAARAELEQLAMRLRG